MKSIPAIVFCILFLHLNFVANLSVNKTTMKVAIIGAGPAGLVTARHCIQAGFVCDVFEQTGNVGGTWVYTNRTGVDENGFPVHSSMYKGLRYVTAIRSLEKDKWKVEVLDVKNKSHEADVYDAVIICNGHYEVPFVPSIKGAKKFKGMQMHSHHYRIPDTFADKKVLVIGGGPSGVDISKIISRVSNQTFLSVGGETFSRISENVTKKPLVKEILSYSVEFYDGSIEDVDAILYCTGYQYSYPFLSEDSGIEVVGSKWVRPLYKHLINIQHPSMAFVGLLYKLAIIPSFEIQARFFIALLNGQFELPSKEGMLEDLNRDVEEKKMRGLALSRMHMIGSERKQAEYFDNLSTIAGIAPVPDTINKLYGKIKHFRS